MPRPEFTALLYYPCFMNESGAWFGKCDCSAVTSKESPKESPKVATGEVDLIALIRSAGAVVQRHRNPSCTLDDLERGGPARQPGAIGEAEKAKAAAPSSGGNKLLAAVEVLLWTSSSSSS